MNSSAQGSDAPEELVRAGPADARTAAVLRDDLYAWLRQFTDVPPTQLSDIVVSTYEALANCADHAYANRPGSAGAMTLRAAYDRAAEAIRVSITDGGMWREPEAPKPSDIRGRGIALMRALADQCSIEGRPHGTTVSLLYGRSMTKV
jgi:anti-sigma regulatory factor (Ser/Thr protein kinase)